MVFHKRHDALGCGFLIGGLLCGIARLLITIGFVLFAPIASERIDVKAELFFVLAAAPAAIDAPECCRRRIGEFSDGFTVGHDIRHLLVGSAAGTV